MRRGRIEKVLVRRIDRGAATTSPDEVIVEEPLEVRLDDHLVATTMRTPGHDYELAAGLCVTDGLLAGAPILGVRYCGEGPAAEFEYNVVTVETGGRAPRPTPRLGNVTSSCGLCGTATLTDLATRLDPLVNHTVFSAQVLTAVSTRVRESQELFLRTGGLHAAAVFDTSGEVSSVREDIGRHNAVDKLIGRRALAGATRPDGLGLFVSGRASFEIVQKAWAGGFSTVLAVSAPSALAVETARAANMTLVGFAWAESLNVYSGDLAP